MTRWGCPVGGELYALRLLAGCPRHPGTALVEEEHMPKITLHGGPSNAAEELQARIDDQAAEPIEANPEPAADEPDAADSAPTASHGEVTSSPGTSSSASDAKPRKSAATRRSGSPSPAPTTANP